MQIGDMPADKCMHSTRLFAEKVMPKLRGLFPEYDNDQRFWCRPLPKRATPGDLPAESQVEALAGVK
jgi:hypothetical protein